MTLEEYQQSLENTRVSQELKTISSSYGQWLYAGEEPDSQAMQKMHQAFEDIFAKRKNLNNR